MRRVTLGVGIAVAGVLIGLLVAIGWPADGTRSGASAPGASVRGTIGTTSTAPPPTLPQVIVPDVVGTGRREAGETLSALGLRVVLDTVRASEPSGTVVAQRPAAGSSVPSGATVRLTVANLSRVVVPSVVGLQSDPARALLRAAGLTPHVVRVPSLEQVGLVVGEEPGGGKSVPRGARITLSVSSGPGP